MSQQPDTGTVPDWTLGWRLQRALAHAGMSVQEIADDLDVSRATIGRWLGDRIVPRKVFVRQWALRTGVAYQWLCHGDANPCGRPDGLQETAAHMPGKHVSNSVSGHGVSIFALPLPVAA